MFAKELPTTHTPKKKANLLGISNAEFGYRMEFFKYKSETIPLIHLPMIKNRTGQTTKDSRLTGRERKLCYEFYCHIARDIFGKREIMYEKNEKRQGKNDEYIPRFALYPGMKLLQDIVHPAFTEKFSSEQVLQNPVQNVIDSISLPPWISLPVSTVDKIDTIILVKEHTFLNPSVEVFDDTFKKAYRLYMETMLADKDLLSSQKYDKGFCELVLAQMDNAHYDLNSSSDRKAFAEGNRNVLKNKYIFLERIMEDCVSAIQKLALANVVYSLFDDAEGRKCLSAGVPGSAPSTAILDAEYRDALSKSQEDKKSIILLTLVEANLLYQGLHKYELPDLDTVLQEMQTAGMTILPTNEQQIFKKAPFGPLTMPLLTRRQTIFLAAGLYLTGLAGIEGPPALKYVAEHLPHVSLLPQPHEAQKEIHPTFPETEPASIPVWKIENKGLDTSGYHITDTAATYENGNWVYVTERIRELHLPEKNPNEPHSTFNSYISINGTTRFKVPMRQGTKVNNIRLSGPKGEKIQFRAYQLKDMTTEIIIESNDNPGVTEVSINGALIASDSESVRATAYMEPNLNDNTGKEADTLIAKVEQEASQKEEISFETFFEALAEKIRNTHLYSLFPQEEEKRAFDQAVTKDTLLTVAFTYKDQDCALSAAEHILVANWYNSSYINSSPFVNAAFCFFHDIASPASGSGNYLNTKEFHMVPISNSYDKPGKIIDPTPSTIDPKDTRTLAYLARDTSTDDDRQWAERQQKFKNSAASDHTPQDIYNLETTVVELSLAVAAGAPVYTFLRRRQRVQQEKHNRTVSEENTHINELQTVFERSVGKIERRYSQEEIDKAIHYMGWFTFSDHNQESLLFSSEYVIPGEKINQKQRLKDILEIGKLKIKLKKNKASILCCC